jgi:ribosomal protein S13
MRPLAPAAALALLFVTGCGASRSAAPPSVLPLRTLRLYETGVGYFERSGPLPSRDQPGLPVPAGHLDDALKTLVVLTPGGKAAIGGVEFGSSMSHGMARAMAGLPLEDGSPIGYRQLLESLEGSVVEARSPARTVVGRLVDVQPARAEANGDDGASKAASKPKDDAAPEPAPPGPDLLRLTLLTERAEVVHIFTRDLESVRPLDPAHAARMGTAIEALLARGAAQRHELRLLGEPGAPITLGYVAETPVWRTTYRLVIGGDGEAMLQAWALIHNDTDEDWRGVNLELVNGRPDSFLFPLAAPRYTRRELVTPEHELATVPQLLGRTADTLWGDHIEDSYGAGGLGLAGHGEGAGHGSGIGLGHIATVGHGGGSGVGYGESGSSLLSVGNLAAIAQATGAESGALFVYRLAQAIELRGHASALVPFLKQAVDAERIAWVDGQGRHARSAVRFANSTSQTLPPGTLAFFEGGAFAGESTLDRLRTKERRFITFGVDLDVETTEHVLRSSESVQRLEFKNELLVEHFLRTTETEWDVENRSGQARAVYLPLSLRANAKVAGADKMDFDAQSGKPIAIFDVPSQKSVKRTLVSVEGLERRTALQNLSAKHLLELVQAGSLPEAEKAVAQEAAQRQKDVEDLRRQLEQARTESLSVEKELERLREDAKAVGDRGAAAQPLVARIVAAEDRLSALRKRMEGLEKNVGARVEAVRKVLERLGGAP